MQGLGYFVLEKTRKERSFRKRSKQIQQKLKPYVWKSSDFFKRISGFQNVQKSSNGCFFFPSHEKNIWRNPQSQSLIAWDGETRRVPWRGLSKKSDALSQNKQETLCHGGWKQRSQRDHLYIFYTFKYLGSRVVMWVLDIQFLKSKTDVGIYLQFINL